MVLSPPPSADSGGGIRTRDLRLWACAGGAPGCGGVHRLPLRRHFREFGVERVRPRSVGLDDPRVDPQRLAQIQRGHLRFFAKHRGPAQAERARKLLLVALRLRGLVFRGKRGRAYREAAAGLASGSVPELLA